MLLVNGEPVQIGSRAFELLLALVERSGRMVTKAELLDAAWPGLIVEENNVSVQIATLRKVLGARTIVTVAGRGYQLSAQALPEKEPAFLLPAPPLLELLGREQELAGVMASLAEAPLTTLVGTGGVGKTALAREAFARHAARIQAPVFWIDLAPLRDSRHVLPGIAKALGIEMTDHGGDADALMVALAQTVAFVALDNCEHLIEEVSRFMGKALASAPLVRWLATSREPLRVAGGATFRLEPLAVPLAVASPVQAMEYGAVALLCKRVVESDRRFALTQDNLSAVVQLCRQLDGLPLAIEMAAKRVATFGLVEVGHRLGQRLRLLRVRSAGLGSRHETLEATYDWSHSLLSEVEQAVFRRLAPFLGGFRVDLAQRVVADDDAGGPIDAWVALDALDALVDKSLVQRQADQPGRFYLLESARDYAHAHLRASGEATAVLQRHAKAVSDWFGPAQGDADRMNDAQWLRHYVPELHNARAALVWACEQKAADDAAQLVTALSLMDWLLCREAEVLHAEVPLDLLAQASPTRRAACYLELSWAHFCDGSHALGAQLAQEAFDLYAGLGESAQACRALAQLVRLQEARPGMEAAAQAAWQRLQQFDGRLLSLRNRLFCAISAGLTSRPAYDVAHLQELRQLADQAGFESMAAICACNLTDQLLRAERYAELVATADQALLDAGSRPRATAFILHNQAAALISLGRFDEARDAARRAFQSMPAVAHFLVATFALCAVREGRLADAAMLHGCGSRIREEKHEGLDAWETRAIAETGDQLEAALGAAALGELMKMGAALSAHEALAIKVLARAQGSPARGVLPAAEPGPVFSVGVS